MKKRQRLYRIYWNDGCTDLFTFKRYRLLTARLKSQIIHTERVRIVTDDRSWQNKVKWDEV